MNNWILFSEGRTGYLHRMKKLWRNSLDVVFTYGRALSLKKYRKIIMNNANKYKYTRYIIGRVDAA